MNKGNVVHMYNGGLITHKRNEIMLLATTWMDLEIIILSEVTQRQIPYDITHMQNLSFKNLYKSIYLQGRLTDLKNKLVVIKGEIWMRGMDRLGLCD